MYSICDLNANMFVVTTVKNKTNAILIRNCLEYKEKEFLNLPTVKRNRYVILHKADAIDEETYVFKLFSHFDFEEKQLTHALDMTKDFMFWESKIPRKVFECALILMKFHSQKSLSTCFFIKIDSSLDTSNSE